MVSVSSTLGKGAVSQFCRHVRLSTYLIFLVPGEVEKQTLSESQFGSLNRPRPIKVLGIYEKEDEDQKMVALANGCHILITTPPALERCGH